MTLDEQLVSAKKLAQEDVSQLLALKFQQSKGLSAARLETTILKTGEENTGREIKFHILVDRDVERDDLPLLQEYAHRFALEFLGYLRRGILYGTRNVNLLVGVKIKDNRTKPLFIYDYSVEQIIPLGYQARRDNSAFPISRKYAPRPPILSPDVARPREYSGRPVTSPERHPYLGFVKGMLGAARDLYRAIRNARD